MKKVLFTLMALAAMCFVACSSDDDDIPSAVTQADLQGKWMTEWYGNIYSFEFDGNNAKHLISNYPKVLRDLEGTFVVSGSTLTITATKATSDYKVGETESFEVHWANSEKTELDVGSFGVMKKTR